MFSVVFTVFTVFLCFVARIAKGNNDCRIRSIHVRQDGGLCFEIPPWQLQPVQLDEHLNRLRKKLASAASTDTDFRRGMHQRKALINSEVTRYMDTVLAPFLDAYHRNIQNSYQQFTVKILKRIKEEINMAVQKKQKIYMALIKLADDLKVPETCHEERRSARTLASQHVANIHSCVQQAREAIAKMGPYAEQMILITKQHMQTQLGDASKSFIEGTDSMPKGDVSACKKELSRAAAGLGYELDLTLSNARRFSEQSCEQLTACSTRARRQADDAEADLRDKLYQCVYA